MKNDILTIGKFTIHGYGLMIGIGIILAYVLAEYNAGKKKMDKDSVYSLAIWALISGYIGSKILYIITVLPEFFKNRETFIMIIKDISSGWVVYGGILGGILGIFLMCKVKKYNFWQYIDLIAPPVALAQGFGRIGCLLAGCCYGIQSNSIFSIMFTNSAFAPNNIPLLPTQIISSGLDFINAIVLLILDKKKKNEGQLFGFYLVFYSIGRFGLEFIRGDLERGSVGFLSTSQFIALFTLIIGIVVIIVRGKHKKNEAGA